jgi:hypothetical protein
MDGTAELNTGCEGCHLAPKHHAPQQTAGTPALEANGWFHTEGANAGFSKIGNTMTAYCTGCHGNFHTQLDGNANWIRHPSDAVLPTDGEYADYTAYDVIAPVARPALTAVSDVVNPGTDMVMCLSCHRAHGSPNDDMLRWEYSGMVAGGGGSGGCFVCHTEKN